MKSQFSILILLLLLTACSAKLLYWPERCRFPNEDTNNRNPFGLGDNYASTSLTPSTSDSECGVENQPIMGSYFEPAFTYIGPRYQRVALIDARKAATSAARLMTPYIKSSEYKRPICLSFDYLIQGEAIEKMTVIQQERTRSKIIYSVGPNSESASPNERAKTGAWRAVHMDINIREGITRYFIEVRMKTRTGSSSSSVYDVTGHGLSSLGSYRSALSTNTADDDELRNQGIVMIKGLEYTFGQCRPEYVSVSDNLVQYTRPSRPTTTTTTTTTPSPRRPSSPLTSYWDLAGNYQG